MMEDKEDALEPVEKRPYGDMPDKGVNNKLQHQQSMQHNRQDLDQNTEVDVKPSQLNLQHIDVTINNKIENYSGRIVGTTISEATGHPVVEVKIYLYFGAETEFPVCRTKSDQNGNYSFEDLPPGFYTIVASTENAKCVARNIRVLPGETCSQSLTLVKRNGHSTYDNGR